MTNMSFLANITYEQVVLIWLSVTATLIARELVDKGGLGSFKNVLGYFIYSAIALLVVTFLSTILFVVLIWIGTLIN
jgi:hypothetical protein